MGEYDYLAGMVLLGILLNTYLFGIVTYQFALYYHLDFNDPLWLRMTVHTLLVLDTFQSTTLIYLAWWYLVSNYDNPSAFSVFKWPFQATIIESAITAFLTHHFMGYRIYQIWGKWYLYIGIVIVSLADLVAASICTVKSYINVGRDPGALRVEAIWWLTAQVVLDFFLACCTSAGLYRQRTNYRRTNRILYRYIRSAIQVGILSTLFATGILVAFLTVPQVNLYGLFLFPIGRIYTNAIMDTLTVRASLRSEVAGAEEVLDTDAISGVTITNKENHPVI